MWLELIKGDDDTRTEERNAVKRNYIGQTSDDNQR